MIYAVLSAYIGLTIWISAGVSCLRDNTFDFLYWLLVIKFLSEWGVSI